MFDQLRRQVRIAGQPSRDLDRESQAYGLLMRTDEQTKFLSKIDADAFFTFRSAGRMEVREQSLRIPDGVLTLLLFDDPGVLQ